jgi:glycosyltransferase involved in cell wall biosynthesis
VLFVQDCEFIKPGKIERLIGYYFPTLSHHPFLIAARKKLYFSKLRKAHLLCISASLKKKVEKLSNHKPFVVKYFVDKSKVVSANSDRKYIGYINPILEKGLGILIKIALAMPDRKFLVIGDAGPTSELLKELFSILGNVRWLPFEPNIKCFWNKIRIFLTPSFWGEGFHRVVLEAMVNGIPVLATDQQVIKELLNGSGFTFNTGYHLDQIPATSVESKNIDIFPWIVKIKELDSTVYYNSISKKCKIAAENYLNSVDSNQNKLLHWITRITE